MKKTKIKLFGVLLAMGFGFQANAQESKKWTLEECVQYAIDKNLSVKRSDLNLQISDANLTQSKYNVLPSVNAGATNTYNFGQTIDPFTNQFASKTVRSNSFFVNAQLMVFNGFQKVNTIKANKDGNLAAAADLEKMKNDISLNVANTYLQILFNKELLRNAESQIGVTKLQQDRVGKLVAAGSQPKGSLYDIEAQYAQEKLNIVNAKNQLGLSILNLKQLLVLDFTEDFEVEEPNIEKLDKSDVLSTPGAIYENSVAIMPEISSSENRLNQAANNLKVARGGYSPRLSLSGSYGTGYSGASKEQVGFIDQGFDSTGAIVSGTNQAILARSILPIFNDKSFNDQLNDNINSSIGISLNIPIFNGLTARNNVSISKIRLEQANYDLIDAKRQLRQQIESAYLDAVAALEKYEASTLSVKALNESFKYTQERFNVGLINSFDFNNEKNKLIQSESNLLQAKYEYIFKTKVLEFYQGKSLSLKN